MLIDAYFKQLKKPQAAKVYQSMAREASDNNLTYEEFLLGVLEQEVHQRENNRVQRRIRQATFPMVKTLYAFDFMAIPSLNKPKVLALADGEFIIHKENVIILEFAKWTEVFGDEQMTAALLDRLTHRAHILNMNGESYRLKQSISKKKS